MKEKDHDRRSSVQGSIDKARQRIIGLFGRFVTDNHLTPQEIQYCIECALRELSVQGFEDARDEEVWKIIRKWRAGNT